MAKKAAYWDKRAERRALDTEKRANEAAKAIDRAVAKAAVVIRERTDNLLRNYQKRYGLDEQTARAYLASPVSYDEYTTLLYEIATLPDGPAKREAQARAASGAYSYRMSREQSLEASIRVETGRIAQAVEREATSALGDVARESERQTAYEQQMQTGGGPFAQMDGQTLDTLLHTRWSGANYSRRIWTDRDRLARALKESIAGGLASHRRYGDIADELANNFGVARWKAMRLVRTEAAFINNLTSLRTLKKGGASSYKILETLDARTCEKCGMMDGRVYFIDQAEFGVNAPPFHPNCRGCIVAADAGKAGRRGRDKGGKLVDLPGDMTYEEWQAWQEAGCPEDVAQWRAFRSGDFDVVLPGKEGKSRLDAGEPITDFEVFAGKGGKDELRVREHLARNYGGNPHDWCHTKAHGYVLTGSGSKKAMIHWFYEKTVGVKEAEVKGWSKK